MITYNPNYTGWLGNQMFQYAAVKAFGLRHGIPSFFPSKSPNLLDIFKMNRPQFIEDEYFSYIEPFFHYQEIPLISNNMIFFGYFQSEKYFKDYENVIRKDFSFKNPTSIKVAPDTTAIHVRRGDYLNLDAHPVCPIDYFMEGMSMFKENNFLIFSDDIAWCKEAFKGDKISFSEGNVPEVDLELMTKCDSHIISNSSFSWWGAWLAKGSGTVVAPKDWFEEATKYETKDLYCEGGVVI